VAVAVATPPAPDRLGTRQRVEVWEVSTGKRVRSWDLGQRSGYTPLALSPDGSLVAAGGEVFDTGSGKRLRALRADGHGVTGVAFSGDGLVVATGGERGEVCVWEAATGQLRRRFAGHRGAVDTLAFSPDGRLLVSGCGSDDPTLLVWDLTGRLREGRLTSGKLGEKELAKAWADLREADAAAAHESIWALAASAREAVRFLAAKLRPVPAPAAERIGRLIKDVGSARFEVRRRAEQELASLGDLAAGELRKAAAEGASLEAQQRARRLLDDLASPTGEGLLTLRAVEALSACGPEARPLLRVLAEGAAGARLTREARAALTRLAERVKTLPSDRGRDP
jgi:hypothetical protein